MERHRTAGTLVGADALLLTVLVISGIVGEPEPSILAGLAIALASVAFCCLAHWRMALRDPGGASLVVLFAFAYVPGAATSITHGPIGVLPVGVENTAQALLAVPIFLALAFLVGDGVFAVLRRRFSIPAVFRERAGTIGLLGLLLLAAVAAFSTGFWSYYGGQREDTVGGIRLEMMYLDMVAVVLVLSARKLYGSPNVLRGRPALWYSIGGAAALMLFALQSRRYMLFSVAFVLFDIVLMPRSLARRNVLKTALAASSGVVVVALVMYASQVWRTTASDDPERSFATAMSDTGKGVAAGLVSGDEVVSSASDRLSYLWMDSVAWEYRGRLQKAFSISEAFVDTALRATPSVVVGTNVKTDREMVNCDNYLAELGIEEDIPCTASAEAILGDSVLGVASIILMQGLALGLGLWLTQGKGDVASGLGFMTYAQLAVIESSAFASIGILRQIMLIGGFVWIVALLARLLFARRIRASV